MDVHFGPRTEVTEDRSDQGPKWMQQCSKSLGVLVVLYLLQHNEVHEINTFYAEVFTFLFLKLIKGSKCRLWQLV